jgi:hypothetical protein
VNVIPKQVCKEINSGYTYNVVTVTVCKPTPGRIVSIVLC